MANVTGTLIPALSQNDTNTNPHNPMYGIWQAGAQGALLNLIGTDSSASGGNSMAPPNMINVAAQPTVIDSGQDTAGLVSTGQLSTLLPNANDVTNVLESMKRISDAKLQTECHPHLRESDRRSRMPRPSRPAPTPRRRTCSIRTRTPVLSIRTTTR